MTTTHTAPRTHPQEIDMPYQHGSLETLSLTTPVDVLHDGQVFAQMPNGDAAFSYVLGSQSSSVHHALRYDGWAVRPARPYDYGRAQALGGKAQEALDAHARAARLLPEDCDREHTLHYRAVRRIRELMERGWRRQNTERQYHEL